jgi:hypothetical protein
MKAVAKSGSESKQRAEPRKTINKNEKSFEKGVDKARRLW